MLTCAGAPGWNRDRQRLGEEGTGERRVAAPDPTADKLEVTESGGPAGGGAGCPAVCLDAEGRGRIAEGGVFESVWSFVRLVGRGLFICPWVRK